MPSMTQADYRELLPVDVSNEVLGLVQQQSAVMSASKVIRMAAGSTVLPLAAATPTAKFVNSYGIGINPADLTARKPFGEIQWDSAVLTAEEIAITTAVPDAFLMDAGFDVWANVRARLASELAMELDRVFLTGVGAPPTFTRNLAGVATAIPPGATEFNTVLNAWTSVANNGGQVDHALASPAGVAALMGLVDGTGRPLYLNSLSGGPANPTLLGVPISTTRAWNVTPENFIVGDFDYSIVGVRQDLTWDTSTDGVVTDAAGKVVISAFQDDMTIIRMYMRIGFMIGQLYIGGSFKSPFAKFTLPNPATP